MEVDTPTAGLPHDIGNDCTVSGNTLCNFWVKKCAIPIEYTKYLKFVPKCAEYFVYSSVFKGGMWLHLVNPVSLPLTPAAACLSCHLTCLCAMSLLSAHHRLGHASRSVCILTPAVRGRLTPYCPALSP